MKKLAKLNILIVGRLELRFEIEKNIILVGPNKVTLLYFTVKFLFNRWWDKKCKKGEEASLPKLSELNP